MIIFGVLQHLVHFTVIDPFLAFHNNPSNSFGVISLQNHTGEPAGCARGNVVRVHPQGNASV